MVYGTYYTIVNQLTLTTLTGAFMVNNNYIVTITMVYATQIHITTGGLTTG